MPDATATAIPLTLADVQAAQARIQPHVRRTPMLDATATRSRLGQGRLVLKLECLQATGSFKARGAVNTLLSLPPERVARGLVTASGGNHGLGVAYAGWLARVPVTIYLPHSTPAAKARKLEQWGARVVMQGAVWDEANEAALAVAAERDGPTYVHPFADPPVMAGQGTIALEVLDDLPQVDTLLVAIGGGGLIGGVSLAAKSARPHLRVIGIEPVGAATLYASLRAGELVELPSIETAAGTLAPRKSAQLNLDIISRYVDEVVLVTDEQMRDAARWLWFELGVAAELAGAAAVAAVQAGKVSIPAGTTACAIICGAGTDGL